MKQRTASSRSVATARVTLRRRYINTIRALPPGTPSVPLNSTCWTHWPWAGFQRNEPLLDYCRRLLGITQTVARTAQTAGLLCPLLRDPSAEMSELDRSFRSHYGVSGVFLTDMPEGTAELLHTLGTDRTRPGIRAYRPGVRPPTCYKGWSVESPEHQILIECFPRLRCGLTLNPPRALSFLLVHLDRDARSSRGMHHARERR